MRKHAPNINNNNYLIVNKNYSNKTCKNWGMEKEVHYNKTFNFLKLSKCWIYIVPSLLALVCYVNGIDGDFVHDDVFAITSNPDVYGKTSISEMFQNDFWGKPLASAKSHKSYRPLTVMSFR